MKAAPVHGANTKYHINPDKLKTQMDSRIITEIAVKMLSRSANVLYKVV
jgi:hypothetical protein